MDRIDLVCSITGTEWRRAGERQAAPAERSLKVKALAVELAAERNVKVSARRLILGLSASCTSQGTSHFHCIRTRPFSRRPTSLASSDLYDAHD